MLMRSLFFELLNKSDLNNLTSHDYSSEFNKGSYKNNYIPFRKLTLFYSGRNFLKFGMSLFQIFN